MAELGRPVNCRCFYTLRYPISGNACAACHLTVKFSSTVTESETNSTFPTSTFRNPRTDNAATNQAKHLAPLPFEHSATRRPRLNLSAACAQGRVLDLKAEKMRMEGRIEQLGEPRQRLKVGGSRSVALLLEDDMYQDRMMRS